MKVVGYMRVSGDGQIDGDGFHRQKEAIEAFCRANQLQLSHLVREEGISGTLEKRPGLTGLIAEGPCVVVVERLDRLARDLMVQELIIREFWEEKIILYSVDQGGLIDLADHTADPTRNLIRQVLGAVSQWAKSADVLKLAKARARTREERGKCEGRKFYAESPKRPQEKKIAQTILAARALGATFRTIQQCVKAEFGTTVCLHSIGSVLRRFDPETKRKIAAAAEVPQG